MKFSGLPQLCVCAKSCCVSEMSGKMKRQGNLRNFAAMDDECGWDGQFDSGTVRCSTEGGVGEPVKQSTNWGSRMLGPVES